MVPLASVPPIARDALVHHLALPKLYLRHGAMVERPDMVFSYYPMNLDLLYLIPLSRGNDVLPAFIHGAFGLLTAALLYAYVRRRLGGGYALAAALFFLSTPIVIKLSTTAYVDLGLSFFSTAALLCLVRWSGQGFRPRDLLPAGLFCGLAMGTKYNGLVVWVVLCLSGVCSFSRQRAGRYFERPARRAGRLPFRP